MEGALAKGLLRLRRAFRPILLSVVAASVLTIGPAARADTKTHDWAMDEPAGTGTMLDDGSPTQTPGDWENIRAGVPGVVGTAYRFNGSSSRVVVDDDASLDPGSSAFSTTVHVKFTVVPTAANGGDYDLIRKGLGDTNGGYWKMEIYPTSSGTKTVGICQMQGSAGAVQVKDAPYTLNDGVWHTITCAKDDDGVTLTIDRTSYFTAANVGSIANSDPLTLGAKIIGGDWYNGNMDDVSLQIGAGAAPISLRSSSSAANPTATTLQIPAPSGVLSGDVMLAEVAVRGTPTILAPSGWTLVRSDAGQAFQTQSVYYRTATSSEPASYTWSFSSAKAAAGGILAYVGANGSDPIDADGGQANAKSTSLTAPSITTSVGGDALVAFFGVTRNNTVEPPPSMNERFDLASNAVKPFLTAEGSDQIQSTAGPTGSRVATASLAGASIGQLIAIRPA
jgi:hypothetical protein